MRNLICFCMSAAVLFTTKIDALSDFEEDIINLASHFQDYAKDSIGVDSLQRRFYELTSDDESTINPEVTLDAIVRNIQRRTDLATKILSDLRTFVEQDHRDNPEGDTSRGTKDCCSYTSNLQWNYLFQSKVNMNDFCEMSPYNHSHCSEKSAKKLTSRLFHHENMLNQLRKAYRDGEKRTRFVYYGGKDGYYVQYPATNNQVTTKCACAQYDPRYTPWYIGTATQKGGKDVVLAIDVKKSFQGGAMRKVFIDLLDLLLDSLGDRDRILATFYGGGKRFGGLGCMRKFSAVTPALIDALRDVAKNHEYTGEGMFYSEVFEESYNALQMDPNRTKAIYLVTSGYYLDKKDTTIDKLRARSSATNCQVALHMMIITDGSLNAERLRGNRDIAEAACSCGHCTSADNSFIDFDTQAGVWDVFSMRYQLRNIFSATYTPNPSDPIKYTLPYSDFMGTETLIDACTRCLDDQNKLLGVACTSFTDPEFLGVSTHQSVDSYVFLIDTQGRTYVHPKFSDPYFTNMRSLSLDIRLFETSVDFHDVYVAMVNGLNGSKTLLSNSSIPLGGGREAFREVTKTYRWKKIPNSPFSVAMVTTEGYKELSFNITSQNTIKNEKYHRIDLYNDNADLCLVKEKPSLANSSTIKLAMDVFAKSENFSAYETIEKINKLIDFLSLRSKNPPPEFLSPDVAYRVRDEVVATSHVDEEIWTRDNSSGNLYTIWRYVGTEGGVMRGFPGHTYNANYDPRVRPWYIGAKAFPNLLIITTPYKDAGTGKVLISMAKALFKRHGNETRIAGVGGLDFSVPYLRSLLVNLVTDCKAVFQSECMLIDLFGYLVYHPDISIITDSYNETHLIEKEPRVAKHMIGNSLMTKDYAVGYFNRDKEVASGHLKFFYRVQQLVASRSYSEGCLRYTISPVTGTNLLIIKITKNDCPQTSCPCPKPPQKTCNISTTYDLQTCECPCFDYKVCLDELTEAKTNLIRTPPSVTSKKNVTAPKNWLPENMMSTLPDCMDPKCHRSNDHIDCNRLGCAWCFRYPNGTYFTNDKKFCGYLGKCFPSEDKSSSPPSSTPHISTSTSTTPVTIPTKSSGLSRTGIIVLSVVVPVIVIVILVITFYLCVRDRQKRTLDSPVVIRNHSVKKDEIIHVSEMM